MLCFEIKNGEIEIYCDLKGMQTLVDAIERLKIDGDHIHLNSPLYGGKELDDKTPWGNPAVGMVTISWSGE